jgi:hypothetical protein
MPLSVELRAVNLGTRAERFSQGKKLRQHVARERHADLKGVSSRNAVAILAESDAERVPELVPERYARMMQNPFAFLRGAAAVMAADLAHQPVPGIKVQAGGDSHLMNFGAFITPEDNILFDVNDFDETIAGVDFTVDLKRLAASVAVAVLANGESKNRARAMAAASVSAYRKHMFNLLNLSPLEIWHSRIDLEEQLKLISNKALRRKLTTIISKARGEGLEKDDNFPRLITGSELRIADKPPAIFHLDPSTHLAHKLDINRIFAMYRDCLGTDRRHILDRHKIVDLAFKAVGVGSVGRRVVEGQQMMQAASDIFLGYTQDDETGRQFYVRTLKNHRLGGISEISELEALSDYARVCGRTLARAHARSGDPALIAGYMGKSETMDDALASFAIAYAGQTAIDHAALVKAKSNRDKKKLKLVAA